MASRTSLQDYQRDLAERLRNAQGAANASMLGVQVDDEAWLVDLREAGEVIPVPPITPLPLTRPWFKGLTNIRGNLYSVVDFPAFLGVGAVAVSEHSRLLLIGDRFRTASALLIDRSLGLRNPEQLKPRTAASDAGGETPSYLRGEFDDGEGRAWKELDLPQLVRHTEFLSVSA